MRFGSAVTVCATLCLAAGPAHGSARARHPAVVRSRAPDPLVGIWDTHRPEGELVRFERVASRAYRVQGAGWHGLGRWDGARFTSTIHGEGPDRGRSATFVAAPQPGGALAVTDPLQPDSLVHAVWHRGLGDTTSTFHGIQNAGILPQPVRDPSPVYPPAAIALRITGTVKLWTLVGPDGRVWAAHVRHSVPGLDAAAIAAVKQWRFTPATARGRPIHVWIEVPLEFKLK